MTDLLLKFRRDPVRFIRRALYKTLIAPLKYRTKSGYDATRYWRDRLTEYGMSLKGVGDEGLSEQDNWEMYKNAGEIFLNVCKQEGVNFASARVLEIGCGNGFYTRLLQEQGVKRYLGVDITDVLFPDLARNFPFFQFARLDVTTDPIDGKFDLILMIDVIEHIVGDEKLNFAMTNIQSCLAENGRFLVAPVAKRGKHSLFYVRFWSIEDIKRRLHNCLFGKPIPFRYSHLLLARKPSKPMDKTGAH